MNRFGPLAILLFSPLLQAQDNAPKNLSGVHSSATPTLRDKSIPAASPAAAPASLAAENQNQVDPKTEIPISFTDFILAVQNSNLNYAAQKFNVSIAQAQISLARLWPNPTISGGYTTPFHQSNTIPSIPEPSPVLPSQDLPHSTTASISEEIPLGGKLSSKEAVATANAGQAQAQLEDFFRNLRGTAASAYIDAITAKLNEEQLQKSYKSLQDLADLNAIRYKDGDIAEVDYLQARVAALEALSTLHAAESTLRQANIGLAVLVGRKVQVRAYHPLGNLALKKRTFDQEALIADAVAHRSDVIEAMRAHENAEAQLKLVKANRVPDVTASLNYTHNSESQNAYAPSPENDQIGFSLQMPLPLSNFDTDDLKAASLTVQQSEKQIEATQVQAETDVREAVSRYRSAVESVNQYSGGILNEARRVLDITIYSYKKGKSTLLDVRQAESDLTTTYQNYYTALDEQAKALVNLEQMTGFWDIELP
jgi:cobalt-zinc-cadmium efflux system outer membrane protein